MDEAAIAYDKRSDGQYKMQHFDIDGLIEYGVQSLAGTVRVVNPAWRKLDVEVRKARQAERRLQAKVAMSSVQDGVEIQKKAEAVEAMQAMHEELARLRLERKQTPRKVTLDTLPEDQRPNELLPLGKMFCGHGEDDCLPCRDRLGGVVETPFEERGRGPSAAKGSVRRERRH